MGKTNLNYRISFKHLSKIPHVIDVNSIMEFTSKEEMYSAYPMFESIVDGLNGIIEYVTEEDNRLSISKVESDYGEEIEISYLTDYLAKITPTNKDDLICRLVCNLLTALRNELVTHPKGKILKFNLAWNDDSETSHYIYSYKNMKNISYLGVVRYRDYKFSEPLLEGDDILGYYEVDLAVEEQDVR